MNRSIVIASLAAFVFPSLSLSVKADDVDMSRVTMPAVNGYVLSFAAPGDQKNEYYRVNSTTSYVGGRSLPTQSAQTSIYVSRGGADGYFISITLEVFEDEISFDDWVDRKLEVGDQLLTKIHKTGFDRTMGQKTFFSYESPHQIFVDGEFVTKKFRKPTGKYYYSLFDGHALVTVGLMEEKTKMDRKKFDLVRQVASTVVVNYEESYESASATYFYSSPNTMIARMGRGPLRAQVQLSVLNDWIATEAEIEVADEPGTLGRIVVDIAPYDEETSGKAPQKLTLVVEGMPEGKTAKKDFLAKGKEVIRGVMAEKELLTYEDTAALFMEFGGFEHCMSRYDKKPKDSSNGIHTRTYSGKNAAGQDIKARIYTSGGANLACNYVYSAAPDTFDASIGSVEEMLKSLTIEFLGPMFLLD